MTREDMELIVDFFIRGGSAKSVIEAALVEISQEEVEDFLWRVAWHVEQDIRTGVFDV